MVVAQWRLIVFVAIGMLILQAESAIANAVKILYFAFVVLSVFLSVRNLNKFDTRMHKPLKIALLGSGVALLFMMARAWISVFQGEDLVRVVRDFFTYFMLCAAPIIGADAGRVSTARQSKIFVLFFTGVASVSFSVFWLSARDVSLISADRLVMYSIILAGLGIILGGVYGMVRLNPMWLLFGSLCLLAILVTGTRSGIILILGLVGALGPARKARIPFFRFLIGATFVFLLTYVTLPVVTSRVATQGFMENRLKALKTVFDGGVSSDASGAMRQFAFQTTFDDWVANPMLGVGLGHAFPNPSRHKGDVDFQLDTGMLLFAKFGLIGVACLVFAFLCYLWVFSRFHMYGGRRSEAQTVGTAFLFMCFLFMPLGAPTEDKGMSFGLSLAFCLLIACARDQKANNSGPLKKVSSRTSMGSRVCGGVL